MAIKKCKRKQQAHMKATQILIYKSLHLEGRYEEITATLLFGFSSLCSFKMLEFARISTQIWQTLWSASD